MAITPTTSKRKPSKSRNHRPSRRRKFSVVDQVRQTFSRAHRLSALIGFVLGGFVPLSVYVLVHYEVQAHPYLWGMVTGGLLYSAVSVYLWSIQAFHMRAKAIGFVILVEGTVTLAHTHWLSIAGLAVLIAINGISCASALQTHAPSVE